MFSRLTSDRFQEKSGECNPVGPGSYEMPSTLDERALAIRSGERFQENAVHTPGPGAYATGEQFDPEKSLRKSTSSKDIRPSSAKENRAPSLTTPRGTKSARKTTSEVDTLKRQLNYEEKLRSQAEARLEELKASKDNLKKSETAAKSQLLLKEKALAQLQKSLEAEKAACREATQRADQAEKQQVEHDQLATERLERDKHAAEAHKQEIAAATKMLESEREIKETLAKERDAALEQIAKAEAERIKVEAEHKKTLGELEEERANRPLQADKDRQECEQMANQKLESERNLMEEQMEKMRKRCEELTVQVEKSLQTADSDKAQRHKTLQEKERTVTHLKAQCQEASQRAEQAEKERLEQERLADERLESQRLATEVAAQLTRERDAALEKVSEAERDRVSSREALEELRSDLENERVQLAKAKALHEESESRAKQFEEMAKELEKNSTKLVQAESSHAEVRAALEARFEAQEMLLEAKTQEAHDASELHAAAVAELDLQLACQHAVQSALLAASFGVLEHREANWQGAGELNAKREAELRGRLFTAEDASAMQKAELDKFAQLLKAEKSQSSTLAVQVDQLRCENEALLKQASASDELQEVRTQCEHLQCELDAVREQRDALEKDLGEQQALKEEAAMFKKSQEDIEQKADLLSNENEELQKRVDALSNESETLRKRVEFAESENTRAEAAAVLNERDSLQKELEQLKFAKFESMKYKKAKEEAEQKAKAHKLDADNLRQQFERAESERSERQSEVLSKLQDEAQEQQRVCRHMSCTLQQLEQENEELKGNAGILTERLSLLDDELNSAKDDSARLAGHANTKQKIHYMTKLKEDNEKLNKEVVRLRNECVRMQNMPNGGVGLFEKFLSQWGAASAAARQPPSTPCPGLDTRTPRRRPASTCATSPGPGMTPGARTPARPRSARNGRSDAVAAMRDREAVEDLQMQCELQERALERIRVEFQHVLSLVRLHSNGKTSNACTLESLLEHLRGTVPINSSQQEPRTPKPSRRSVEGSPPLEVDSDMDEHPSSSLGE